MSFLLLFVHAVVYLKVEHCLLCYLWCTHMNYKQPFSRFGVVCKMFADDVKIYKCIKEPQGAMDMQAAIDCMDQCSKQRKTNYIHGYWKGAVIRIETAIQKPHTCRGSSRPRLSNHAKPWFQQPLSDFHGEGQQLHLRSVQGSENERPWCLFTSL